MSTPHRSFSKQGKRHGQKPYDKIKDAKPSQRGLSVSSSPSLRSSTSSTFREKALHLIRKRYPRFKPRNDFDILTLSSGVYNGPEDGIFKWLDDELAVQLSIDGNTKECMDWATEVLSVRGPVTGIKPLPGDPDVFIRRIPNSPYSLRLFPGNPHLQEFCMDFIETSTGKAVNSPFKFELFTRPDGLGTAPGCRVISMERSWGIAQKDIRPGEEKFVLRDGTVCTLVRPGHKDVRFNVPTRAATIAGTGSQDVDQLDFPRVIQ